MSSPQGRGRGRGRGKVQAPLRKPGEFSQSEETSVSQDDEKPPVKSDVQGSDQTANKDIEITSEQLVQDVVGTEKTVEHSKPTESPDVGSVLLRAVNNPEFVPKASSVLASAVNAPEFVPGQTFHRYEETAEERLTKVETFVNNKIKQVMDDPGLLDEISMSMANYLSIIIKVENDMMKLSDLLFEKCISEQNFQYTGSRLANYLDKYLVPKSEEDISFRVVFLKRCKKENSQFKDEIHTNPERACAVALFFGELLMNYKTNKDETVDKFVMSVSNMIKQLLSCPDSKLLICAGKLLKLTGSTLEKNDELFETVAQLANDPHVDRTAQTLFNRVCQLRRTSWGRHDIPQTVTYTVVNTHGAQGYSMYFPNMDGILEEQSPDLPVFVEEEWNEYETDVGQEQVTQNTNEEFNEEELYRTSYLEQYGELYEHYVPYATEDNWSNEDDYDDDYEKFLLEKQQ